MGTSTEVIYREAQSMARPLLIAEWIRQALGLAHRRELVEDTEAKLDIIRAAARHNYPVTDIEGMLAEIDTGYCIPRGAVYGQ